MKKIGLLLILVFLVASCEKSDVDNELVGTEWIESYGPDMVKINKVNSDGSPYFITFQQRMYYVVLFEDNSNGTQRYYTKGGGSEYETDITFKFTYKYNSRTKSGTMYFQGEYQYVLEFRLEDGYLIADDHLFRKTSN